MLYFGCYSGNFYALDKITGRETWKFKAGDSILSTDVYDQYYRFVGYQIFQLKDRTVSVADIYDEDKARLVAQCDIRKDY
jgi:outer membrane protein assembly factor BamB